MRAAPQVALEAVAPVVPLAAASCPSWGGTLGSLGGMGEQPAQSFPSGWYARRPSPLSRAGRAGVIHSGMRENVLSRAP